MKRRAKRKPVPGRNQFQRLADPYAAASDRWWKTVGNTVDLGAFLALSCLRDLYVARNNGDAERAEWLAYADFLASAVAELSLCPQRAAAKSGTISADFVAQLAAAVEYFRRGMTQEQVNRLAILEELLQDKAATKARAPTELSDAARRHVQGKARPSADLAKKVLKELSWPRDKQPGRR